MSYDRLNDYQEVDRARIYQRSYLEFDPSSEQIYAIDTGLSPRDMETFHYSDGTFTDSYNSPYHGDYQLYKNMTISPDGSYIFNASGNVFTSSSNSDRDMKYMTSIEGYLDIRFSPEKSKFHLSQANQIMSYDRKTMTLEDRYYIEEKPESFFHTKDGLYTMTKKIPEGSNLPQLVFEKIRFHNK